jgi:4-alpha-glucanotransferase
VNENFHIFRIDHVLGFYRIYAFPWRPNRNAEFLPLNDADMRARTGGAAPHFVPRDDSTPQNCDANKRDGEEYLRVVLTECGAIRVVGEDLGTVPDYMRPSLRSLGIAGFKIPQWETNGGRVKSGSEYERLSVATYATHDHKPIRALWQEAFEKKTETSEQAREDLEKIAQFSGMQKTDRPLHFQKDFYPAMMAALFRSEAWIAVAMITDLLARTDRFNVPGTASATNWTRRLRMTVAQLGSSRVVRHRMRLIRELLEKNGRT